MNLPNCFDPVIVTVDIQERLVPSVYNPDEIVARASVLLRGAAELGVRVIATEHTPKDWVIPFPPLQKPLSRKKAVWSPRPLFRFSVRKNFRKLFRRCVPTH